MYTFYESEHVAAQCNSVQLFIRIKDGKITYKLIDLDINVNEDIVEQTIDFRSSLEQFQSYCLGKYGLCDIAKMKIQYIEEVK